MRMTLSSQRNEGRIEEQGVSGRPPVTWINRADKYWREGAGRQGMEYAEKEWLRGGDASGHPLRGSSCEGMVSEIEKV